MSVRKIAFVKIDAGRYVNHETGVEIIRGTLSSVWQVLAPTPDGFAFSGSRAHFRDARVFALIVAGDYRAAIAAAYGEAADINARREIDEAAEWQATPAYRHFAHAGRGAGGYRATLDILHDEALVEDRRRAQLQSRWDAAARAAALKALGPIKITDEIIDAVSDQLETCGIVGPFRVIARALAVKALESAGFEVTA